MDVRRRQTRLCPSPNIIESRTSCPAVAQREALPHPPLHAPCAGKLRCNLSSSLRRVARRVMARWVAGQGKKRTERSPSKRTREVERVRRATARRAQLSLPFALESYG